MCVHVRLHALMCKDHQSEDESEPLCTQVQGVADQRDGGGAAQDL